MTNLTAGIDFSLNAPSVVIFKDGAFTFIPFLRQSKFKKVESVVPIEWYDTYENELQDIDNLTTKIVELLIKYNINKVFIEGYSYASKGSYYIQLISYQSVLRNKLFQKGIEVNIVSPKSVKAIAGKGNLDKVGMFDSFCNQEYPDCIFQNDFQKFCQTNKETIYLYKGKRGETTKTLFSIKKPYEDLVDAFFCLKCSEKI